MRMFVSVLFLVLVSARLALLLESDYVVSTSQRPPRMTVKELLSQIEQHLQTREALDNLEKTKEEIIERVRIVLDKKFESIQIEENNIKDKLKTMQLNITSEFGKTKKEIKETKNYLRQLKEKLNMEQKVKDDLKTLKDELTRMRIEISDVKNGVAEFKERIALPTNCKEVQRKPGTTSGIYRIQPKLAPDSFLVWCDMTTKGGGWVYLLNRFDGSQNFYLNWTDYKNGFGNISREHWLGLEHLYEITNSEPMELLFELIDWDLKKAHAHYDNFKIGSECENYIIRSVGEYDGDAGDSFSFHQGYIFYTADKENINNTCSTYFKGAWWYEHCYRSHLTGRYMKYYNASDDCAIQWKQFHGYEYCLKETRMMVRPRN